MSCVKLQAFGRFIGWKGLGSHVADSSDRAQNFAGLQWAEGVLSYGWKPLPLGCGQEGQSVRYCGWTLGTVCLSVSVPALAPHQ